MAKKTKPIKLAPGKYAFKGYTIKSYGNYDKKDNIVWKAFNDETDQVEFAGSSLHEVTNLINQKNI